MRHLAHILILFAAPCFGESYLCVGEEAIGLNAHDNYSVTRIETAQWVLKKLNNKKYTLTIQGDDEIFIDDCTKTLLEKGDKLILCDDLIYEFILNLDTSRYFFMTGGFYIYEDIDEIVDYPRLEIGKCTKI